MSTILNEWEENLPNADDRWLAYMLATAFHETARTMQPIREFGAGRIGKVEVDFFSGPKPTGTFHEPSAAMRAEKDKFGSSRRARWFGR